MDEVTTHIPLVDSAVGYVCDKYRNQVPSIDCYYWRRTYGLDAPAVDVKFTVDTDPEEQLARSNRIPEKLDHDLRITLAQNGYLKQTDDTLFISFWSREALDRGEWR